MLVNSASQPYNENIFLCLFVLMVWLYLRWLRRPSWDLVLACGIVAGVGALVRESILGPFLLMLAYGAFVFMRERRVVGFVHGTAMFCVACLVIAPWTLTTYQKLGVFVPVSSISGSVFGAGNNECMALEPFTRPFYGDSPCPSLDLKRKAVLDTLPAEPKAVMNDRAYAKLGAEFVREHPGEYVVLSLRRLWTAFLPFHPMQRMGAGQKLPVLAYYLCVFVVGVIFALRALARPGLATGLLLVVIAGTFLPMVLIFVSHDGRFRAATDLMLACFAGRGWTCMLSSLEKRFKP